MLHAVLQAEAVGILRKITYVGALLKIRSVRRLDDSASGTEKKATYLPRSAEPTKGCTGKRSHGALLS